MKDVWHFFSWSHPIFDLQRRSHRGRASYASCKGTAHQPKLNEMISGTSATVNVRV